jgi:hypothetical protein
MRHIYFSLLSEISILPIYFSDSIDPEAVRLGRYDAIVIGSGASVVASLSALVVVVIAALVTFSRQ